MQRPANVPEWFHNALYVTGRHHITLDNGVAFSIFDVVCSQCGSTYNNHANYDCVHGVGGRIVNGFTPIPPEGFTPPPPTFDAQYQEVPVPIAVPIEPERAATELDTAKTVGRITVKISCTPTRCTIKLSDGEKLPTSPEIVQHLSHVHKQQLNSYYGQGWESYGRILTEVIRAVRMSVPIQAWSDAIAAAIALKCTDTEPDEAETVIDKRMGEPGYLAMAGVVYKLTPSSVARPNALSVVRRNILERAKKEADRVTDQANKSAAEIMAKATASRAAADKVIAEAKRILPEWLLTCGYPVRTVSNQAQIGMLCYFAPKIWEYKYVDMKKGADGTSIAVTKIRRWPSVPGVPAVPALIWAPVDLPACTFAPTAMRVDNIISGGGSLPHISTGGTCLGFGGVVPKALAKVDDIRKMHQSLQSALNGVNFGSLLKDSHNWGEPVRHLCHPQLLKVLDTGVYANLISVDLKATGGSEEVIDYPLEEKATFTIST
jgi:hypothetical protein